MTQRLDSLSRRTLFSIAAGSASALALGRALGGTAHAGAPVAKIPQGTLGKGLLKLPTDSTLDPELQIFAEKLLARSKQAVLTAATKPGQIAKDDKVGFAASKIVESMRAKRSTRLKANIVKPVAMKSMEKFGKVEPSAGHQFYAVDLEKIVEEKKIKKEKKKIKKEKKAAPKEEEKKDDKPQWTGPLAARIEYQLNAVKCVNMTDGESGSDEILLGGQLITPGGVVKQIDRFKISDDFDTNEVKRYDFHNCKDPNFPEFLRKSTCPFGNPKDIYEGRKLGATLLGLDKPWPATIGLVLIMGEEDPGGGFGAWVEGIYDSIKDELQKQLDKWGVQAGTALAGELGAAIGAVLAQVVGDFLGWLVNLCDNPDDPIASNNWITKFNSPEMSSIRATVGDPLPAPSGIIASSPKRLDFVGDGGKYEVRMHWRVNS